MSSLNYSSARKEVQDEVPYTGFLDEKDGGDDVPYNNISSDQSSDDDEDEGDQSSSDSNSSKEHEESGNDIPEGGIIRIPQGNPVWTGQELNIVAQLKDRWFHGTSEEQATVVEEAVDTLNNIEPRDPVNLRKKVLKWLKKRAGKRLDYGPGHRPSLQTVLAYYKEAEVTETVRKTYGVIPGGRRSPFLGFWKHELGRLQKALRTDPSRIQEYEKLEAAREEWTRRGPPRQRRKKMAEKKTAKMVMEFAGKMYFELGARCSFSVGYRNTNNQACVGHFDFNKSLGHGKKAFLNKNSEAVKPYEQAWDQYIAKNLTNDETNYNDADLLPIQSGKLSAKKPDILFDYNVNGEPLLPSECVTMKLDDRKHVMRCFLKVHYGIAKGVPYPGSGCTPPWAKVATSPDSFFSTDTIPDGVELKDPSRMTTEKITRCLTHWTALQTAGLPAFKFANVWNDARGEYVEANEHGEMVGSILGPTVEAKGSKDRKGKARAQSPGKKSAPSIPVPANEFRGSKKRTRKPKMDKPADIQWQKERKAPAESPPRNVLHSTNGSLTGQLWPIDPILQNYPTEGPNDPVPVGYNPVPCNYLQPPLAHFPEIKRNSPDSNPPAWAVHLMEKVDHLEQAFQARNPRIPASNLPVLQAISVPSVHIPACKSSPLLSNTDMLAIHPPLSILPAPQNTTLPEVKILPKPAGTTDRRTSKPRTWPSDVTPRQTRQRAKERGVIIPPVGDIVKVKTEKSEGEDAFGLAPSALHHAGPSRKHATKVESGSEEPERKRMKRDTVPKPRPLKKGQKISNCEDLDNFDLKGRRKTRK